MIKFRVYGLSILIAFLVSIYVMTSAGKFHIIDEVSLFAVTESLALRGDVDNAIKALQAALATNRLYWPIKSLPTLYALRDDPRFQALFVQLAEEINTERAKLDWEPVSI